MLIVVSEEHAFAANEERAVAPLGEFSFGELGWAFVAVIPGQFDRSGFGPVAPHTVGVFQLGNEPGRRTVLVDGWSIDNPDVGGCSNSKCPMR